MPRTTFSQQTRLVILSTSQDDNFCRLSRCTHSRVARLGWISPTWPANFKAHDVQNCALATTIQISLNSKRLVLKILPVGKHIFHESWETGRRQKRKSHARNDTATKYNTTNPNQQKSYSELVADYFTLSANEVLGIFQQPQAPHGAVTLVLGLGMCISTKMNYLALDLALKVMYLTLWPCVHVSKTDIGL